MKYIYVWLFGCLFLLGCDRFPKDPQNTLETVSGGVLKAGYSENPPWVIKVKRGAEPEGEEADLLREFAKSLNARIEWTNDTEQNLFEKLEKKELQVVVAGITQDNPWKKRIALTRPYITIDKKKHVFAAIRGENAFIMRLEKFLNRRSIQLEKRLLHETN